MGRKVKIFRSKLSVPEAAMAVCHLWSGVRSKDPSTKVGACIVDPRTGGLFLGYNGFVAGVPDAAEVWERRNDLNELEGSGPYQLTKYDLVVHAERNAVRKALLAGVDLREALLVCTMVPCPACMRDCVAANGIREVIFAADAYHAQTLRDAWLTREIARLAKVRLRHVKPGPTGAWEEAD